LTLDPGSKLEKFGSEIRDKHPGSAILAIFIIYVQVLEAKLSIQHLNRENIQLKSDLKVRVVHSGDIS
jgi:hypothetical protein